MQPVLEQLYLLQVDSAVTTIRDTDVMFLVIFLKMWRF